MDNSGVRVYHTEHLRANDAGIMAVGMAVSPMHIVPPRQPAFRTASLCDKDCTNVIFPERGIKITSVLLHAHQASRRLRLRHVRHDQEMATIARVSKIARKKRIETKNPIVEINRSFFLLNFRFMIRSFDVQIQFSLRLNSERVFSFAFCADNYIIVPRGCV